MWTTEEAALSGARELIESTGAFDLATEEDARWRTLSAIVSRQGKRGFRADLLAAYGGCCAISTCDVEAVLEAVLIQPLPASGVYRLENGLLLRADLHTLFDCRLIAVDTSTNPYSILVAPELQGSAYSGLSRVRLRLPEDPALHPSKAALDWHRMRAGM